LATSAQVSSQIRQAQSQINGFKAQIARLDRTIDQRKFTPSRVLLGELKSDLAKIRRKGSAEANQKTQLPQRIAAIESSLAAGRPVTTSRTSAPQQAQKRQLESQIRQKQTQIAGLFQEVVRLKTVEKQEAIRKAAQKAEQDRLAKLERDRQARVAAEQLRVLQAKALAKRQAEAKAKALAKEKQLALQLATAKKLADAKAKILSQAKSDAEAKAKLKALATAKSAQKAKADALAKAKQDVRIKTRNEEKAQKLLQVEATKLAKQQDLLKIELAAQKEKFKAGEPIVGKPKILEKGGLLSIFDSSEIQSEVGPAFSTGEEFRISELEQRREDVVEGIEATKALERLESGTSIFETGAGFEPVSIESGLGQQVRRDEDLVTPESSEGIFVSGQIQSQLVDRLSDLGKIDELIGAISTELPDTPESKQKPKGDIAGVRALEVFEETKGIEATPDLFPGSTILGTAEELGVGVPAEGFPALKGDLIVDVEKPSEIAKRTGEDPFAVATEFREQTGLIQDQPVSFGELLGFDTPPKPKKSKTPEEELLISLERDERTGAGFNSLIDIGLEPAKDPQIESGFLPFAPVPISSSVTSFGSPTPAKRTRTSRAGRGGGGVLTPSLFGDLESNFGSFVTDIGKSFGFDTGGDFFSALSRSISFERSSSSERIGQKSRTRFTTERANIELTKKKAKAKAAGFTLDEDGNFIKSVKVGKQTVIRTSSTVAGLQKALKREKEGKERTARILASQAKRKAAGRAKQARKKARRIARPKAKRTRDTSPLGRVTGISGSSNIFSVGTTSTRSTSRARKSTPSRTRTRKIRNPFESFGFGDQSGFI
jgi:hypothetical protein